MAVKRRSFIKCLGCGALAALAPNDLIPAFLGGVQNALAFDYAGELSSMEARHYRKHPDGGVECLLCPRHCRITDLERGYCGVRENRGDVYYTLVYGLPCAVNIDPVEKKPLYHFYPGSRAFSIATAGCNVNCKFCQNWDISQSRPEQTQNIKLPPGDVITSCQARQAPIIAYTYSEPVVFYEYMYDIARLGKEKGIKSAMITGGYIEQKPLEELIPVLDAIKVDLKSIRENYYRDIVGGGLKPVLERLVQMRKAGIWLEIVYLVVPTLNDSDGEFRDLSIWIRDNLGAETPLHYSRFYPQYLLKNLPPTPEATLERALAISRAEGLPFVYLGNIPAHASESTYCPQCGEIVIERRGYSIGRINLKGDKCRSCGRVIPGRFA